MNVYREKAINKIEKELEFSLKIINLKYKIICLEQMRVEIGDRFLRIHKEQKKNNLTDSEYYLIEKKDSNYRINKINETITKMKVLVKTWSNLLKVKEKQNEKNK